MQYLIEVDEKLNDTLTHNAELKNMTVPALIAEMLSRYAIDGHIMEQDDLWQKGIESCAEMELDWANL